MFWLNICIVYISAVFKVKNTKPGVICPVYNTPRPPPADSRKLERACGELTTMRLPGMKDWIFDTTVDASVRSVTSLCVHITWRSRMEQDRRKRSGQQEKSYLDTYDDKRGGFTWAV